MAGTLFRGKTEQMFLNGGTISDKTRFAEPLDNVPSKVITGRKSKRSGNLFERQANSLCVNSGLSQTRLMEQRETPALEWRDGALWGRAHCLPVHTPAAPPRKHTIGHSRNKTTQIIDESGCLKKQDLVTACKWQHVSSFSPSSSSPI